MYNFGFTIARISAKDGKIPEWVPLFSDGWIELDDGERALIDRKAFELINSYLKKRGVDTVYDYEHQTLQDVQAPAAGWIKEIRYTEGVGIEARVEWTDRATQYILNGEYRYYSPVYMVRKKDSRVIALHSVALTNAPLTNNLKPILAKLDEDLQTKEDDMNFLKKIIELLGLGESSSEEEVITAVTKMKTDAEKSPEIKEVVAKEVLEALDMEEGDTSAVVASIHAMRQKDKASVSREEFEKLQDEIRDRDANDVVAKAMKEGKITPDQKDWATNYAKKDLDGFKKFVAKAPEVMPVKKLPEKKSETDMTSINEATLEVAKMMDVSEEDLKEYGGLSDK